MDTYWNPFDEMDALRRDVDELFSAFGPASRGSRTAFLPGRSARSYPLLNIATDEKAVTVEALAPGIDPDTLEVSVTHGMLTIAGEKRSHQGVKPEAYHRRERAAGRFVRTLHLDREIDEDGVEAVYRDGILSVTLPRAASDLPRKIDVAVK